MTDLHYLTAAEALRLFRARDLSPVELVSAVSKRAEAVEPVINAFAETFYEQALDQARADVAANSRAAADRLRDAGAVIEEVGLPWDLDRIKRAARIHFGMIFGF